MKTQPLKLDVKGQQPVKPTIDIVIFLSNFFGVEPPKEPYGFDELLEWWAKVFDQETDEDIIRQHDDFGLWQGESDHEFTASGRKAFFDRYNQLSGGVRHAND